MCIIILLIIQLLINNKCLILMKIMSILMSILIQVEMTTIINIYSQIYSVYSTMCVSINVSMSQ